MTAEQLGLWDVPAPAPLPLPTSEPITRSTAALAARKLKLRHWTTLGRGFNPLGQRLHVEAAPRDDREAPGRRCGNCRFRATDGVGGVAGTYPKCFYREGDTGPYKRAARGSASDCRAWWPGCADHEWGDTRLSDDAARSGPM
jgi:hypothetical protein